MAKHEIAIEYKDRHLTRPMLQQIIGAALTNRPDVNEVIIRCRTTASTAKRAAEDICKTGTIRNAQGRTVRVTLAPDVGREGE
jgi:hypothetical protein